MVRGGYPNFLNSGDVQSFAGLPVFIYHGDADPALDPQAAKTLARRLQEVGAKVNMHLVPGRGHVYPDVETNQAYFAWLNGLAQ